MKRMIPPQALGVLDYLTGGTLLSAPKVLGGRPGAGALRTQIDLVGQGEVLLEDLHTLTMPALVVWGVRDRVSPGRQTKDATARLEQGA